jgi:hypothetical protein
MNHFQRLSLAVALAFVALLLGLANNAVAKPITVSAGDTLVFNYDFGAAGVTPAPTYPRMRFEFRSMDFTLGEDNFSVDVFGDLNLQG